MDFVMRLPWEKKRGNDVIWVIVDKLTKSALFLAIKMTNLMDKLKKLYVNEVVQLHRVLVIIFLDRDLKFTLQFWPSIQHSLGTSLSLSTVFHPQMDGQLKRIIQTLKDVLRAYVLEFSGN
jgi:Cdc6-like AAA superfamily ATPase